MEDVSGDAYTARAPSAPEERMRHGRTAPAGTLLAARRALWASARRRALLKLLGRFDGVRKAVPAERAALAVPASLRQLLASHVAERFDHNEDPGADAAGWEVPLHRFAVAPGLAGRLAAAAAKAAAAERRRSPAGAQVSNRGGAWHGDARALEREEDRRELVALRAAGAAAVALAAEAEGEEAPAIKAAWFNVCAGGKAHNGLHHHQDSTWSGVFFASAGGTPGGRRGGGRLVLRVAAGKRRDGRSWVRYVRVPPTPGTIVVFPGWLLHAVEPALCPSGPVAPPRVSLAFNA